MGVYQTHDLNIPVLCVLIISLKVKSVSPIHNSDKMLYLWMNFQKLLDENPQSDSFRVWTSFMSVDKDFWKLKLILPNKTVTKCYVYQWIFKSCLMKIHKVTSLEYEQVVCLLKLVLPNKTVIKCYICEWIYKSCLIKIHKVTSLEYEPVLCLFTKIFES